MPVPPLAAVRALVRVRAVNWGEAEVAISWMVLTAQLEAVKLVELKEAIPLVLVVASAMEPLMTLLDKVKVSGEVPPTPVTR